MGSACSAQHECSSEEEVHDTSGLNSRRSSRLARRNSYSIVSGDKTPHPSASFALNSPQGSWENSPIDASARIASGDTPDMDSLKLQQQKDLSISEEHSTAPAAAVGSGRAANRQTWIRRMLEEARRADEEVEATKNPNDRQNSGSVSPKRIRPAPKLILDAGYSETADSDPMAAVKEGLRLAHEQRRAKAVATRGRPKKHRVLPTPPGSPRARTMRRNTSKPSSVGQPSIVPAAASADNADAVIELAQPVPQWSTTNSSSGEQQPSTFGADDIPLPPGMVPRARSQSRTSGSRPLLPIDVVSKCSGSVDEGSISAALSPINGFAASPSGSLSTIMGGVPVHIRSPQHSSFHSESFRSQHVGSLVGSNSVRAEDDERMNDSVSPQEVHGLSALQPVKKEEYPSDSLRDGLSPGSHVLPLDYSNSPRGMRSLSLTPPPRAQHLRVVHKGDNTDSSEDDSGEPNDTGKTASTSYVSPVTAMAHPLHGISKLISCGALSGGSLESGRHAATGSTIPTETVSENASIIHVPVIGNEDDTQQLR